MGRDTSPAEARRERRMGMGVNKRTQTRGSSYPHSEFLHQAQVKPLAARGSRAAAGSGRLTKGRNFRISTKGSERGHRAKIRCQVALRV